MSESDGGTRVKAMLLPIYSLSKLLILLKAMEGTLGKHIHIYRQIQFPLHLTCMSQKEFIVYIVAIDALQTHLLRFSSKLED